MTPILSHLSPGGNAVVSEMVTRGMLNASKNIRNRSYLSEELGSMMPLSSSGLLAAMPAKSLTQIPVADYLKIKLIPYLPPSTVLALKTVILKVMVLA